MKKAQSPLPRVAFSILMALSLKERHGYEIIKQVELDSEGKIKLGPGALYTSIKQLRQQELIIEVKRNDDTSRRYYKLSNSGKKMLISELEHYQNIVELARRRRLLTSNMHHA